MVSILRHHFIVNFPSKIHSISRRQSFRRMFSPNIAVVHHTEGERKFNFSFQFNSLGIEKNFNLNRPLEESVSSFLQRLTNSVEKALKKKKCKKDTDDNEDQEPRVKFFKNNELLLDDKLDLPIKELVFDPTVALKVLGENYSIEVNPPTVTRIKLPDYQMSGFMTYPLKMEFLNADQMISSFEWFVSDLSASALMRKHADYLKKVNWVKRSEGFFFIPTNDDVGKLLRVLCTPKDANGRTGFPVEAISKTGIEPGPGFCSFENRQAFTKSITGDNELRVITYNILADLYANSDFSRNVLHAQCPAYALDITYRKQILLKELLGYNGDIICLQEVDEKVFVHDLLPVLGHHGLDGCFDKKGGQVSEGSACFWRKEKFEKLDHYRFILGENLSKDKDYADFWNSIKDNDQLKENVLGRTTALQLVHLRSRKDPEKHLIVCNTHLFFKPDADHIRLLQIGMCLRKLEHFLKNIEIQSGQKATFVFCGDFNSSPPFGVMEFMKSGLIQKDHPDWASCEGEKIEELELKHNFQIDSACGTPKYTNFTLGFQDCLDYIFYDQKNLEVTEVVPFPSEEELTEHKAIPSVVFPSDHVACIATLRWKDT